MPTQGDSDAPEPAKPGETPSDGWDLLDDYQVGKDVNAADGQATRRLVPTGRNDEPDVPGPRRETQTQTRFALPFWRRDGSAEQDAEIMARIMAREAARDDEAKAAITRVRTATEIEKLDAIRERQRREIADHLALLASRRGGPPPNETPLQRALREMGDIFLALGLCPDHLEFLRDIGRFCSSGGKLYDHSQIFALRDPRGGQLYSFGDSPRGASTVCYSPRERRWRLERPVPPTDHLTPVERLLPVPVRRGDGSVRFSSQRAGSVLMCEGTFTVYVVRNSVYTVSQLQAAHFLHGGASPLIDSIAERALSAQEKATTLARGSARAIDNAAETMGERVSDTLGTVADSITSAISKTTRLFRRDRKS